MSTRWFLSSQERMDRRSFISNLSVSSAALALASTGLGRRAERIANLGADSTGVKAVGFGDLIPTASKNTGETLLALPRGFEYTVIGKADDPLSDGRKTPRAHDGMATFKVGRELRIVRNHEVTLGRIPRG